MKIRLHLEPESDHERALVRAGWRLARGESEDVVREVEGAAVQAVSTYVHALAEDVHARVRRAFRSKKRGRK